jgi:malate dehydrogenase (oxaloacetate-decarboxylating)(NADP+)
MQKPVNVLQTGASVSDIINLATVTALRAQGEEFEF